MQHISSKLYVALCGVSPPEVKQRSKTKAQALLQDVRKAEHSLCSMQACISDGVNLLDRGAKAYW